LKDVILVAATNRPDIIDPALMRAGRFGKQIEIGLPDADTREKIIAIHLKNCPVSSDIDLSGLATTLKGKTGADLEALCDEAVQNAIRRAILLSEYQDLTQKQLQDVKILQEDFALAMKTVMQESARSEKSYQMLEGSLSRSRDFYS